jgi:hypothetical protein
MNNRKLRERLLPLAAYLLLVFALALSFAHIVSLTQSLKENQQENLKSRVVTVTQRCQLTQLMAEALKYNKPIYLRLEASYNGCLVQLKKVEGQLKSS